MKTRLILLFAAIVVGASFFVDKVPQDAAYHQFADTRDILGIANFWNVVTNLPFLFVGAAGLMHLRHRSRAGLLDGLYPGYIVFFAGIVAVGIGSAWYHFAPGNATLVWDRLPMTIGFMALFSIVVGEYASVTGARRLLPTLLAAGAGSVIYWQYTEYAGAGDLRPYALVQFLPMILIPVLLIAYDSVFASRGVYLMMITLYAFSKLFEFFDVDIYNSSQIMSGHSLKHLVAAGAPALFLYHIINREVIEPREQSYD